MDDWEVCELGGGDDDPCGEGGASVGCAFDAGATV